MKKNQTNAGSRAGISPELVAQAKAGDQAAFTELYEQTGTGLYRTIRSMVRDEDLAWDILQDTYLQAFTHLDKLEADEAFLSWLRRIAVTMAAKKLGQQHALSFTELADEEGELPELPDPDPAVQPELALDRKETVRLVREILAGLPEGQQLIVGMRYYEDMPIKEIAEVLHVAPGTVKAQLCFGRKKIEAGVRALEKQGVKLYGLSPLPFLMALLGRLEPAAGAQKKVLDAVLTEAPAAAGTSAVTVTALTAGQVFLKGLGVKLIAVAAAAALIVGGKLGYDALKKGEFPMIGIREPYTIETIDPTHTGEQRDVYASDDPEPLYSGVCGDELTWRFDPDTGILTLEGSGEMYDYETLFFDNEGKQAPWYGFRQMITSVSLPERLTSIGTYSFCDCPGLTALTIPEGVSCVGMGALRGCTGLTSLYIPESVSSIDGSAFLFCISLEAVSVHPANAHFSADENGVLYDKEQNELIVCPKTMCGAFVVPESVRTIGYFAFCDCAGLTSITLPDGLVYIETDAFYACRGLTSVTIPDSVTRIENAAFSGCTGLTSITFPKSVISIGDNAFSCTGLTSITFPKSVISIGDNAFSGCTGLVYATIPENVTSICPSAFPSSGLTIRGVPGSEAERYANENGIPFEVLP